MTTNMLFVWDTFFLFVPFLLSTAALAPGQGYGIQLAEVKCLNLKSWKFNVMIKKRGKNDSKRAKRQGFPVHLITVAVRLFCVSLVSFPAQSGALSSLRRL